MEMKYLMEKENIKVEGHIGKWYVIDQGYFRGEKVYLLEHQTYGDEAACIIINKDKKIILEDVYDGIAQLWMEYGSF